MAVGGMRGSRVAPALGVGVVLAVVAHLVLRFGLGVPSAIDTFSAWVDPVAAVAWSTLAVLVLRQQPGNRLARVFLLVGAGFAGYLVLNDLAGVLGGSAPLLTRWSSWAGFVAGEAAWPLLWLTPLLFPDGRPVRGLRWALVLGLVWYAFGLATSAFAPGPLPDSGLENPAGWAPMAEVGALLEPVGHTGFFVVVVLGLVSLVVRFRRGDTLRRRQIGGFAVVVGVLVVVALLGELFGAQGTQVVFVAVVAVALPATFGLAVLRFGLYELDHLVSRTVSYALLTGLLVALYAGLVAAATTGLGLGASAAAAVGAVAVAVALQPLRRVLQGGLDRWFDRSHYRAVQVAEQFGTRLRTSLSTESVRDELLDAVDGTLAPTHATVWLVASGPPRGREG